MNNPWAEKRPIFKSLPEYGWQDNEVADWITSAYDVVLIEFKGKILDFEKDFIDPDTAREDALDWLAQLCGYQPTYWDAGWKPHIKRELIKNHQLVWGYKGTPELLKYLFELFGLEADIRTVGAWQVGVTAIGSAIGGDLLSYSIVINSPGRAFYLRTSDEWRLIEKLNRLFMPCWCTSATLNGSFLHYNRWRVGLSQVGDLI